ncbi:hypothetical protein OE88DRAFT_1737065 [Heliocybe sulcata]|uniref:Uncharacterized protein n=1 Tax=Heliocybe sulcata TaxID=5364 RepID=A0A5C3MX39_9AGAM|nr:hypothetical protein OE88DRAFT_1737065 [Heliocybe sulcata]
MSIWIFIRQGTFFASSHPRRLPVSRTHRQRGSARASLVCLSHGSRLAFAVDFALACDVVMRCANARTSTTVCCGDVIARRSTSFGQYAITIWIDAPPPPHVITKFEHLLQPGCHDRLEVEMLELTGGC